MSVFTASSLGFELKFNGPSSSEEYNQKAGVRPSGVEAVLEDAVYNEIYRGTLPDWQDAFAVKVKELTGEDRQVNAEQTSAAQKRADAAAAKAGKASSPVKPILETVKSYVDRVRASLTDEEKKTLAKVAQDVADTITIDPSPSQRSGGSIKKDLIEKANSILGLDVDAIEAKVSKYLEKVSFDLLRDADGKPDRDSLARLVGRYVDAITAEV
jgi:hypothetical protein